MKLGIVQTAPVFGDVQKNLSEMLHIMREFKGKADLLIFPELSLTGYDLKEQLYHVGLTPDSKEIRQHVKCQKKPR